MPDATPLSDPFSGCTDGSCRLRPAHATRCRCFTRDRYGLPSPGGPAHGDRCALIKQLIDTYAGKILLERISA